MNVVGKIVLILALTGSSLTAEVKLGNEVLAAGGFKVLRGKRVDLITNPSGVNHNLESTCNRLPPKPISSPRTRADLR